MTDQSGLEDLMEILERSAEALPESILDLDAFLEQSPLFKTLDAAGRRELAQKARFREVHKGDVWIQEGSRGETFAIVKRGTLSVDASYEGTRRHLADLGPGAVVGEVAVLMGTPRTATVTATSDVELFEFSGDDVKPLLDKYLAVRKELQELIETRTEQAIEIFLGRTTQ